jgi:CheY-like chemotaxis protein
MGVFCLRSAETFDAFWSDAAPTQAYIRLVRRVAIAALVLAALILLGWACNLNVLKCGLPGQRATQPLTAICFALSALSLALSTERCVLCRVAKRICAVGVLLVVIATVWQNALDVDWGLDQLFFADAVVHEQPGAFLRPGRPAAGTLVCLGLLSVCLLLTETRAATGGTIYVWLATVGGLLAATVLLAYAYGLNVLYTLGFYAQVGLISGVGLAVLFGGVLLRRPDLGWVRHLAGESVGAASARRLMLWTTTLFAALALLVRLGSSAALYGGRFEVTLVTACGLGLLLLALVRHARRLNRLETVRHNVTSDLQVAESQLVRAAHDRERQLARLAHELRNPLTPLRNGIEIIRQAASGNPTLARTAEMMSRQILNLVRLVDDLVGTERAGAVEESLPATLGVVAESARMRILVADDNADAADSLAMLLQADGHVVLTAADGRRAIEVAEGFRPDVILMDVAMPHMDGLEAAREIRRHEWGAGIRIIALTAWGQETERRRTREAGMDAHLVKPVDPRALAAALTAGK